MAKINQDKNTRKMSSKLASNKVSRKEKEIKGTNGKSNKGIIVIISVFLILIIVTVLLVLSNNSKNKSSEETEEKINPVYNGYFFNQTAEFGLWSVVARTPQGDRLLEFYYHPQQVDQYAYDNNITKAVAEIILRKGKFLIGYDVNYSDKGVIAIAGSEIGKITGKVFGIETKSGFVEYMGDERIPVINCSIANYKNLVLEIRLAEENKIVYDNYCIIMYTTSPEEAVKLADFLSYKLLGIIPNAKAKSDISGNVSGNLSEGNESINASDEYLTKKDINYSVNLS